MKSTVLELSTGSFGHVNPVNHSNFDDYVFVEPDDDNDPGNSRKLSIKDDYDHCDDATQIFLSPYKNIIDTATGGIPDDAEMSTTVYVDNEEIFLHDSYSMISCDFEEDLDDEQQVRFTTLHPITAIEEIEQDPKPTTTKNLNCTKKEQKTMERRANSGSRLSNKKRRSKRMKEMKKRAALAAASESLATRWALQKPPTGTNPLSGDLQVTGTVYV
jgi:hypothetical protein